MLAPCAGLAYSNPYFGAEGLSPSPSQAGEFNQAFSPAPGGAPPSSALGFRRLGALPQSQLGRLRAQEPSPGGSDEAMVDGEGEGGEGADQQPPAASLAGASPGTVAGGSGGSRERPEEDEFAGVLGAGGWAAGWRYRSCRFLLALGLLACRWKGFAPV